MPAQTHPEPEPIYPVPRIYVGSEVLDIPEPEWVLEDFIQAGGLTILHGVPAAGKSLLAQDWSMVVSNGWEWCGREAATTNVLYIMGEGQTGLRGRLLAWLQSRHTEYVPTVHWVMEPVSLWAPPGSNFTPEQHGLLQYVEQNKIGLVVADTLSATFGGGNENMQQDMNQYLKWFKTLMGEGVATLIVHHESKGATGTPRGSTVLAGAADTIIRVEPTFAPDGETTSGCVVRCKKQKDGMPFGRLRLKLESYNVETDRGSSVVLRPTAAVNEAESRDLETQSKILEYVQTHPGVGWNALSAAIKGRKAGLQVVRDQMIEDGLLEWGPDQKGLYALTEGGDLL
jgi:hypothetical protein